MFVEYGATVTDVPDAPFCHIQPQNLPGGGPVDRVDAYPNLYLPRQNYTALDGCRYSGVFTYYDGEQDRTLVIWAIWNPNNEPAWSSGYYEIDIYSKMDKPEATTGTSYLKFEPTAGHIYAIIRYSEGYPELVFLRKNDSGSYDAYAIGGYYAYTELREDTTEVYITCSVDATGSSDVSVTDLTNGEQIELTVESVFPMDAMEIPVVLFQPSALVTSWGGTPSDGKYPSEKLVSDSLAGKQGYYHSTDGQSHITNPKEGDIEEFDEIVVAENVQNAADLTDISVNGGTSMKIASSGGMGAATSKGKLKIYGISTLTPSGSLIGTVEAYDAYPQYPGMLWNVRVVDSLGEHTGINLGYNMSLAISLMGLQIYPTSLRIEEEISSGQTSLLQNVTMDIVFPHTLNEYKNGVWYNRLSIPSTVDNAPIQNSNNLVRSGGVYNALADKQSVFTNAANNAPTNAREGDIWIRAAYSAVVAPYSGTTVPVTWSWNIYSSLATAIENTSANSVPMQNGMDSFTVEAGETKQFAPGELSGLMYMGDDPTSFLTVTQSAPAGVFEYRSGAWVDRSGDSQKRYSVAPASVDNPKEGDICAVPASEEKLNSGMMTSLDLTPYTAYKIKIALSSTSGSATGSLLVTHSDNSTETLDITTDLPVTYNAGEITAVSDMTPSSYTLAMAVDVLKVTDEVIKEYINGQWTARPTPFTVDQTFTPASTNPQSGIAMAGALAGKQDNMVVLTYGTSTWNDFVTAYNKNAVIYCNVSGRMAFMAWHNLAGVADKKVEFHYFRSANPQTAGGNDEMYIYTLSDRGTGTWTIETRDIVGKIGLGNGIKNTSSGKVPTLAIKTPNNSGLTVDSNGVAVTKPVPSTSSSDNGKVLGVTDGNGTLGWVAQPTVPAPEVFVATYGTTTYNDVATAISANKVAMCNYDGKTYYATMVTSGSILFASASAGTFRILTLTSADAWSASAYNCENEANKKTTLSGNEASNAYYPTTKATYDAIHPAVVTTQPAGGFAPNVVYDLGTLTGTVTFALASPTDNSIANPYHWTFDTGSTAPTITWPANLTWAGGSAPTVNASKHYEIFVRNGYATFIEF